nr:MAG TPA: hypothetical protein [Caudoviricetes sp.]
MCVLVFSENPVRRKCKKIVLKFVNYVYCVFGALSAKNKKSPASAGAKTGEIQILFVFQEASSRDFLCQLILSNGCMDFIFQIAGGVAVVVLNILHCIRAQGLDCGRQGTLQCLLLCLLVEFSNFLEVINVRLIASGNSIRNGITDFSDDTVNLVILDLVGCHFNQQRDSFLHACCGKRNANQQCNVHQIAKKIIHCFLLLSVNPIF